MTTCRIQRQEEDQLTDVQKVATRHESGLRSPSGISDLSIKWVPRQPSPTGQVWESNTRAAESPLTRERVIEHLILARRRTLNALDFQKRRGHQEPPYERCPVTQRRWRGQYPRSSRQDQHVSHERWCRGASCGKRVRLRSVPSAD